MSANEQSGKDIDQIRQLIFGEQSANIERKFDDLQDEISQIKQQIRDVGQEMKSLLAKLESESLKSVKTVQKSLEESKSKIEKALRNTESSLTAQIASLESEKTTRGELAEYLTDLAQKLMGENHGSSNSKQARTAAEK